MSLGISTSASPDLIYGIYDLFLFEFLNLNSNRVTYISRTALKYHQLMAIPENFGQTSHSFVRLKMQWEKKKHFAKDDFYWLSFHVTDVIRHPSYRESFVEHCALKSCPNVSETPKLDSVLLYSGLLILIQPEPRSNIKIIYETHCGDKTTLRPSYLHNEISYTGEMPSLYWIGAQNISKTWSSYDVLH